MLGRWRNRVPRMRQLLSLLLASADFTCLPAQIDSSLEISFPIKLVDAEGKPRTEFNYDEIKQVEAYLLQKVAP